LGEAQKLQRLAMGLNESEYNNFQLRGLVDEHTLDTEAKKAEKKKKKKAEKAYKISQQKKIFEGGEGEGFLNGYDRDNSTRMEKFWDIYVTELVDNDVFREQQEEETSRIANAIFNISKMMDAKFCKESKDQKEVQIPNVRVVSMKLIQFLKLAFSDSRC
jgi:hypothetical protein